MMTLDDYKKNFIIRYDYESYLKYFSSKDFDGLKAEKISFKSIHGDILKGNIYYYDGYDKDKLIVFVHGIGPGHLSYMREIEYLCKNNFRVLAYDMTGTGMSDGDTIYGLSEALADLDYALDYVWSSEELKNLEISVIGHSLGAYASLNIAYYKPNIKNIVAISGFESLSTLANSFGVKNDELLNYEKSVNPGYAISLGIEAIDAYKGNMLIIHSNDDNMVNPIVGINYIKELTANKNVKYLLVDSKGHNPNYKETAVMYMASTMKDFNTKVQTGLIKTEQEKIKYFQNVDFYKMTEQDENIFSQIIDILKE